MWREFVSMDSTKALVSILPVLGDPMAVTYGVLTLPETAEVWELAAPGTNGAGLADSGKIGALSAAVGE